MGQGLFIVLEGIDGAGKSEQARRLCARLRTLGRSVVETREPTDGYWGRRYRAWARGEIEADAMEVLDFFLRDRREHVDGEILPGLARGEVVVCDRYVASTLAYQAAQGVDREQLRVRSDDESFPEPDVTLWLRIPVEASLSRIGSRERERFEQAAFLDRVDQEYCSLGLKPIDASGSPDEVEAAVWARVGPLLDGSDAEASGD